MEISDIDNKVQVLTDSIKGMFDKHCPYRTARISKLCAPWLTYPLKIILNERDKALRKYNANQTPDNWQNYKELRNFALASVRREKAAYLQVLSNQSTTKFYKALKSMKIKSSPNCFESIFRYRLKKLNDNFTFSAIDIDTFNKIIQTIKSNAAGLDGIAVDQQLTYICYILFTRNIQ